MSMFDLSGKVIVVIGGSKSIGFGMCEALAKQGASVIVVSRHAEENEKAAERLRQAGGAAWGKTADIKDIDRIREMLEEVRTEFGRVDVLFCNASVARRQPLWDVTPEDYDYLMDINLRGTFFSALNCARIMKEQGFGKIVCTTSLLSFVIQKDRGVYAMTKAASAHMVRSMATEFGPFGITVNGIAPGLTLTDMNRKRFEDMPEELADMVSRIALGHPAQPADFGGIAVFLASDASNHLNGSVIPVDGGESCL
ncbi:SDR family NAD(P)-dependent oxidoreductase [Mailhella sp.]|uniref:SDR family NAD(P)-dependent oxidoreductase n=1 Tax=Mailhella sp. TaxID=1981029 RepID=UPI0040631A32